MPLARPSAAPLGFLDYCVRNPSDCGVDPKGPNPVKEVRRRYWNAAFAARRGDAPAAVTGPRLAWTPETRTLVERVNRQVNQAIVEQSDMATYGVKDYWAIPTLKGKDRYGDCEDYVLMKRRDLIVAGLPPEAMFIALARTREGREHAVLILATDRGELVLDSLTAWIVPWPQAPYRWLQRQRPGSPFDWSDPAVEAVAQGIKAGGG
ncbi:MAG: transglutaminase-like cysteine peptidase [Proteobacteria bacterium]|nr:transglutaminase-like cysteine peptidase [Pseudomonadota bacterium]